MVAINTWKERLLVAVFIFSVAHFLVKLNESLTVHALYREIVI